MNTDSVKKVMSIRIYYGSRLVSCMLNGALYVLRFVKSLKRAYFDQTDDYIDP